MASTCRELPAAVRSRVVLRLLSRAESPETVCRRLRLCAPCLHDWTAAFVDHGTRGLVGPAGSRSGSYEQELLQQAKDLRRALKEAEEELAVWEKLRALTLPG